MSVTAEQPPALEPLRVVVVTLIMTPHTQAVVAELRRGAMQVELCTVDILAGAPEASVYIVSLAPPVSPVADELVAWAG
ncbi:MAG: hypothetical protein H7138_18420, partial [Myxococcales bacterium]|nr:hypothetical protein [Myxococcales bacterium]